MCYVLKLKKTLFVGSIHNMKFNIITIFPDLISSYASESILGRAQKNKIIKVKPVDLRAFASDKRKSVDDTPYGGGAGMVMKPEPIYKALKSLGALSRKAIKTSPQSPHRGGRKSDARILSILLSPRGKQFDQRMAEKFSKMKEITFVCGRYEGVDQRVSDFMVDEEISVGPYILAGGELGALIIIEAVSRLKKGVLGNFDSLREETFNTLPPNHLTTLPLVKKIKNTKKQSDQVIKWSSGQVEYPQYTKPEDFMGWKVPGILLSGNHKLIEEWRNK